MSLISVKMNANEEFLEFVEKYPECYAIAESGVFMKFLRAISTTPAALSELDLKTKSIETEDVDLIVLALESAKLVRKTVNIQRLVYYVTDKGKELIEKYDAAKKGM